LADHPEGAQAEVVHLPVRIVAQGLPSQGADTQTAYVALDSIAEGALLIIGEAGFFQENTRVRLTGGPAATATAATPAPPPTGGEATPSPR
jgi:hypothetical protein